jgi:hypothetical protein
MLFPKLVNNERLITEGLLAYMRRRKTKIGNVEPPSQKEIAMMTNQFTKDTVFCSEPIDVVEHQE